MTRIGLAEEPPSTSIPDWRQIVQTHRTKLATVDSNQAAAELFMSTIGPAGGLPDAAATLAAKGIPAKLAKELLLSDVTTSAQRLIAALAVLEVADSVTHMLCNQSPTSVPALSQTRRAWLTSNGNFPSFPEMSASFGPEHTEYTTEDRTALALAAGRVATEAGQQAMAEWWTLKSWKDRVRALRGQSLLCGTWQWVIHNHQQHHQEQKLSVIFPPPGYSGTGLPGLAEAIVLGDTVYLRWEVAGKTQEDSLLFSKEGQRLEGTFVNSQGGWGSITGKRTSSCNR